jgi:type II secretory pathway pseudopilin PulG
MRIPRPVRDESGFTLVELIVTLVLEMIIFGALASAFVLALNGGSAVNESLQKSSDARFAASYIASDARNSSGPEISLSDSTSCADANPPVPGPQTAVARFNWNAPNLAGSTTANISNYVLVSGSLMRRHCEAGTLVGDSVLATSIAAVTVVCAPVGDCSGAPTSVTVAITETPDTVGGVPYTYSLTAAFRKLVGGGSALPASPLQALVVFGSGGCGVNLGGNGDLHVYGNAVINTADGAGCTALNLSGSGAFTATTTSILAGGSCAGSTCPPVTSYPTAKTDPYTGLVPPSTVGRPNRTGCIGPSGSKTAQPGVYVGVFSVSDTCAFASGIYILQAGFSVGAGAVITTAAAGVLIYITGGAFTVGGGASMALTAGTVGTYAGLAVWQSAADSSTISFSGGGALSFNGAIYAPSAQLSITGNSQTPIATSIVVQTLVLTGTGALAIGGSLVPLSISAPATLPASSAGRPYPSTTLTAVGGDGKYQWSASGLPSGMVLGTGSGVISGTPTVATVASVVVTLNDVLGDPSATKTYTLTIDAAPMITSVTLANVANGGTAGIVEKGDTITVVFSAQMSVASLCSTWTTDTTDQSLNANSDVTVTLNDGTSPTRDTISVTSATCAFNFGALDLGVSTYISGGAAVFNGSGSSRSTIAWTAASRTLLITLGAKSGAGTAALVTSSTPVYNAAAAIQDSAGAPLANSPFTLPAGKQF